ncbi:MAG: hypothetical protein OHK93_007484, partial [Ramalina farinacea]|nr:hypothetical protein [Ramalina farinacea]
MEINPPVLLEELINTAITQLDSLREYVRTRTHVKRDTEDILSQTDSTTDSSIQSLEKWKTNAREAETQDPDVTSRISKFFNELGKWIQSTRDALEHRLKLRWRKVMRRIQQALRHIEHREIETFALTLLTERHQILDNAPQQRSENYKKFRQNIEEVSSLKPSFLDPGHFASFWEELKTKRAPDGNPFSPFEPGDGTVYTHRELEEAVSTLHDFHEAWKDFYSPRAAQIPTFASDLTTVQICLVLNNIKKPDLIKCFYGGSVRDLSLPADIDNIKLIIQDCQWPDSTAEKLAVEQYRVVRRPWEKGQHIKMLKGEPLSLCADINLGWGSFGNVYRYQNVHTTEYFAVKKSKSSGKKKHILREIESLMGVEHQHIIKYIKSYERGKEIGIILLPLATTDLGSLLKYYEENCDPIRCTPDIQELPPIIKTAFGCLSSGLLHLHEDKGIRHRDIRPSNILYLAASSDPAQPRPAQFLWADFGLAHYFGDDDGGSKTQTPRKESYSPRYAAPEVLMRKREITDTLFAPDQEHSPTDNPSEGDRSAASGTVISILQEDLESYGHGRKTDVFSCGCVFLEIVSTLAGVSMPISSNLNFAFADNIKSLQDWAQTQALSPDCDATLRKALTIASQMIAEDPVSRPTMCEVTLLLLDTEMAQTFFCTPECMNSAKCGAHAAEKKLTLDVHATGTSPGVQLEAGGSNYVHQMSQEEVFANGSSSTRGETMPDRTVSRR